jgi:hypothetical protein
MNIKLTEKKQLILIKIRMEKQVTQIKKEKTCGFVILAFLAYVGFWFDIFISDMFSVIYKKPFENFGFSTNIVYFIIICIAWGIWGILLYSISKNKLNYNIFSSKEKPAKINIYITIFILILITATMTMLWNFSFKPITELDTQIKLYGILGIITFIFQYIYYGFETVLIILTISFAQEMGEKILKKHTIPWGGIFLGVTWGLLHVITKNAGVGFVALIESILFGYTYLLLKKNIAYAYPFIFLMFVL